MTLRVLAALVLAATHTLQSQELHGVVLDSAYRRPLAGVVLVVMDSTGATLARTISNERGMYRVAMEPSAWRIRALRIGFRVRDLRLPARARETSELDLLMVAIPVLLEPMRVTAAANCPHRADASAAYSLLEQARAGLLATIVAREARPATLKLLIFERTMDGNSDRIERQQVQIDSSPSRTVSFSAAATASDFVEQGFAKDSGQVRTYFGPDAEVLLDDWFLVGYCIRIQDPDRNRPNQVGLGFSPVDRKRGRIDVDGALWIDTVAKALRDFDFRFVGVEHGTGAPIPGGRIWFREMPNGVVLIDKWFFRLVGMKSDTGYTMRGLPAVRRWYYARESGGEIARAIWPDGMAWKGSLGTVRIHVVDHKGRPATGLVVRLTDTDYLASPDTRGDLEIPDVLPGPYSALVVDSSLASSGIALGTSLNVFAVRDSIVQATLVAPSPVEFQRKACSQLASRQWVPVQVVRGGAPVDDARWDIGQWLGTPNELVTASGVTGPEGTFGFCDRYSPERVLDVRARENSQFAQPVIVTVSGVVKDLKIELPSRQVP